jgi:hypothetical protein
MDARLPEQSVGGPLRQPTALCVAAKSPFDSAVVHFTPCCLRAQTPHSGRLGGGGATNLSTRDYSTDHTDHSTKAARCLSPKLARHAQPT